MLNNKLISRILVVILAVAMILPIFINALMY
jgi:hypothetical protein